MDIKGIVRENLVSLLKRDCGGELPEGESGVSRLAKRAGKKVSWSQRLLNETDSSLSSVAEAARAFDLQPWQLLVPKLDPDRLPAMSGDTSSWPFEMVDRLEYEALPQADRAWVQSKMDSAIKDRIDALRKRGVAA